MNYFNGSVSEAIVKAKKENGIFIVFIYDKSELSQNTREKLKNEESGTIFSLLQYVAIEVENGSKDAIQFAQIYPLIVIPSLFFISPTNGVPLEVLAGNVDSKTLMDKVKNISSSVNKDASADANVVQESQNEISTTEEKAETNNIQSSSDESNRAEEKVIEQSINVESNEYVPEGDSDADPVCPPTSEGLIEPESTASVPEPTQPLIEERVARAQELISKRQEMKEAEELEEEKQKEVERRRQSSEVAKAKQKREEQERIDMNKQRKKEKEDDRLARERVKAQIAADKAERLARMSLLKGDDMPFSSRPIQEPLPPPINQQPVNQPRKEVTRIKFRFPDNSSEFSQFSPEATLRDVQTYLIEIAKVPFSKFRLVGTLPPRTFTEIDMPLSLQELGLSPSAIIIVKPITTTSTNLEPIRKSVILFFWTMLSPLVVIYQYLRGFLGLGTRESPKAEVSSDEEDAQSSKKPRTEGSYTTRNRPKTAYGRKGESGGRRGEGGFLRREGNIHRLNQRGDEEDDDDNNTWNGNSTQQM